MNPLLPAPSAQTAADGAGFVLRPTTRILTTGDPVVTAVAQSLAAAIESLTGSVPTVAEADGTHDSETDVILVRPGATLTALELPEHLDPALAEDAFRLAITGDRVELTARTVRGLTYGAGALTQLADTAGDRVELPSVIVVDRPRFAWRGLSLDVARNFQSVEVILSLIDVLASLRLNVLHLHLTDDQGWRLEMPSRPELTAKSGGTAVEGGTGGFYTVEDFAEIVRYAQARHITVIPELDVPGHVNAALHAYGELNPSGQPTEVYTGVDVGFSRLRDDLPSTDAFLRDVFADLAAMTPGPYLHLGGDEPLSLDPDEYIRLVERAATHVRAAGKQVVGWQEAARANLPAGSVVQYWKEREDGAEVLRAALDGTSVVLSPASRAYFDTKYDASSRLGLDWVGHMTLHDAYDWEPLDVLPGLPPAQVVGLEAALWSETIRDADDLYTLLLPRLAAFAEVAWSAPERRDWEDFRIRLMPTVRRWEAAGLAVHRSPELPW